MSVTTKVISVVLASTFGLSAAAYTGEKYVDTVKDNYKKLEERVLLTADEAKTKIDAANGMVQKLEKAFNDQLAETEKANTEIETAKTEMDKANKGVDDANADMLAVKNAGDAAVANTNGTNGDLVTVTVTSTYELVSNQALTAVNVTGTDKKRVANPNSAAVTVQVNGTPVSIAGGDVLYIDKTATFTP